MNIQVFFVGVEVGSTEILLPEGVVLYCPSCKKDCMKKGLHLKFEVREGGAGGNYLTAHTSVYCEGCGSQGLYPGVISA